MRSNRTCKHAIAGLMTLALLLPFGLSGCGTTPTETTRESESPWIETSAQTEDPDDVLDITPAYTEAELAAFAAQYPVRNGIPTLYVTLRENNSILAINQDDYIPATYSLVSDDEAFENIYEELLSIKGRGNWSWRQVQKPFALKLNRATSLLGMGAAKKWVLIANFSDKTLLRNYMTLGLARTLGMRGAPEAYHVDLVVNGEYRGSYLLTEKVELHEERLDLPKNNSVLMEMEYVTRHDNCAYCMTTDAGVHIMVKEVNYQDASETVNRSQILQLLDHVNRAEKSMKEGYDAYSQYLDLPSFVDWYIVNEFVKNLDSRFQTSCYTYLDEEGKLCMGPCWDYDTCYGNQNFGTIMDPEGYHVGTSAIWYQILLADKTFRQLVAERWTQLRDDGVMDDFYNSIDPLVDMLSASEKDTHTRWPEAMKFTGLRGGYSLFTYEEEVAYYKNWIQKRIAWFDSEFYLR